MLDIYIEDIWTTRLRASWEMRQLTVVSREGFIKLKRLRSNGQDLDDIAKLENG
jgi:hypothetical protein